MRKKKSLLSRCVFRIVRLAVRLIYGKTQWKTEAPLPEKHAIFVGNHAQIHGPLVGELFMPKNCYLWCAGEIMNREEFPRYALEIFWPSPSEEKKKRCEGLARFLAPLASCLFGNARTVEVRRDYRIKRTFRDSMDLLDNGATLMIFPENDDPHNAIVNDFHECFVDLAHRYYKKTGVELSFVPVYNAPKLKTTVIGKPLVYNGRNDPQAERKRVVSYLAEEITRMARSLPVHEVIPFKPAPNQKNPDNPQK